MKTFNEGDRVNHPRYGAGTVVHPYEGTGSTTVQFDSGDKYMTGTDMLSLVPKAAPFKYGDRVRHNLYGTATVSGSELANLVLIIPDSGANPVQVHPVSLTPLPKPSKFKVGDRVSHPLHRDGVIEDIDGFNGLHTVNVGGNSAYYALEHQITPAVPEPRFRVLYTYTHGNVAKSSGIPMSRKETETYLQNYPDWSNIESITITRAKG